MHGRWVFGLVAVVATAVVAAQPLDGLHRIGQHEHLAADATSDAGNEPCTTLASEPAPADPAATRFVEGPAVKLPRGHVRTLDHPPR